MSKRIGLIGYPIQHSLSPRLFKDHFAQRPDILSAYSYELIEKQNFQEAFDIFRKNFIACNITSPFKEEAFAATIQHSYNAERCGATNLLVKDNDRITAYNTDFSALVKLISENIPTGSKVLVAGCGGAGKAATAAALECGMKVDLANRTAAHAEAFAERLHRFNPHNVSNIDNIIPLEVLPQAAETTTAIIFTLPPSAFIAPRSDNSFTISTALRQTLKGKTIIEAVYSQAIFNDIPDTCYISGIEWLRLQAIETYRILRLCK